MATTFSPSIIMTSEEVSPGQYKIVQLESPSTLPSVANDGDRMEIDIDVSVFSFKGYVDTKTKEIGIEPKFFGIPATNYYGSLTKGLGFECELVAGRGHVNINLVGKDVVVRVDFKGRFGIGNQNVEKKILTLP